MEEFEKSVNAFLEFIQYKILKDNGRITHNQAIDKAYKEYETFNKTHPIESDFDKAVKKMIGESNDEKMCSFSEHEVSDRCSYYGDDTTRNGLVGKSHVDFHQW